LRWRISAICSLPSCHSSATSNPPRARNPLTEPLRHWPAHSVDDFGRDPHLVQALTPLVRLRWNTSVGGLHHLPTRGGALLVCNNRRWAMHSVAAAFALSEAAGRPVRFVGRPDTVPFGPWMRRIGGLLSRPDEVRSALHHHELVIVSCAGTADPRHAGVVDHQLIGAAVVEFEGDRRARADAGRDVVFDRLVHEQRVALPAGD